MVKKIIAPQCQYCGQTSTLVSGESIYPSLKRLWCKRFYLCTPCNAYVGTSPDGFPLGTLANAKLRDMRKKAHASFDTLWRGNTSYMSRFCAYHWLKTQMNIPSEKCHIGMFNVSQCKEVITLVQNLTLDDSTIQKIIQEHAEFYNQQKFIKHLKHRKYDVNRYKHHYICGDIITFVLYNLSGQMIGYQEYNWKVEKSKVATLQGVKNKDNKRYYTYVSEGQSAVWGLENLDCEQSILFITEGIFKASAIQACGYNAIATLSNNPKHLRNFLSSLPYKTIVIADNDKAGMKLLSFGDHGCVFTDNLEPDEMATGQLKKRIEQLLKIVEYEAKTKAVKKRKLSGSDKIKLK